MKNKNRILLFAATFLFLNVFFVGVKDTNAACEDIDDAFNSCLSSESTTNCDFFYDQWVSCMQSQPAEVEYDADDSSTWNMDNFETTNAVDSGGNSSNCDSSSSCWFYNCCSDQDATATGTQAETPEQIAAEKAINDKNYLAANSTSAAQQNAVKQVNTANAALASCGGDVAKCADAQTAVNKANEDLLAANAKADAAIAAYNASNATINPATATNGSGFRLCANGVRAMVCDDGGGTPIVLGLSDNRYSNGGGLPVSYGGGSGGVQAPKCEANFQDIGGVCFPMNTGLSSTPIYVIVSNIFSWLMGLFTTLAVLAFVISGVQYFMASGDESMAEKAKENATNAIIGIIVGLSGFIIIKAIAAALSGQSMFF